MLPDKRVEKVLEQLQILSMKKGRDTGFDMSKFNEGQIDKLLGILEKNEDNAYKYHTKKIDADITISSKKIDASIVDQKTFRYSLLVTLAIIAGLTAVLILYKPEFFIPWLTFLTGIVGGFGLGKLKNKKHSLKKEDEDSDDSED